MANVGIVPVDFETPVGEVRLLIGDTDAKQATLNAEDGTGDYTFYSDAEITALIRLSGGARGAAVAALRAIATSTALKLKKWSSADLMVDGPAITTALLAAARAIENAGTAATDAAAGEFYASVPVGGYSIAAHLADLDTRLLPYGII